MKTSKTGIDLIKKYEGFSVKIYLCPAGKPTIGYGHVVLMGEKFPPVGISAEVAENLLKNDVLTAENAINNLVNVGLSQNQFDALASFIYNIGAKAFANSKLLKFINESDFASAVDEFQKWIFVNGKPQNGLKARRGAEREVFTVDN